MDPQSKACPQCAEQIPADAKTCPYCKSPLDAKLVGYCAHCHTMREANAQGKCLICGEPVVDAQQRSSPITLPGPTPVAPPKSPAHVPDADYTRPGSYIDQRLLGGEQILFRTRLHWMQLVNGLIAFGLAAGLFLTGRWIRTAPSSAVENLPQPIAELLLAVPELWSVCFYLVAALFALGGLGAILTYLGSEVAITSQRLLGRVTSIIPRRIELSLTEIGLVTDQAGLFEQGSLVVLNASRQYAIIPHLPRVKEFRWRLNNVLPNGPLKLKKNNPWPAVILLLVLLLVIGVVFGLGVYGEDLFTTLFTTPEPIVEASFENFAQLPVDTKVVMEGYLKLSPNTHCEQRCNLFLEDYADPENDLVIFIVINRAKGTALPNQMEMPPDNYFDFEVKARMENGEWAQGYDAVRLTGYVCRTTTEKPCLSVTSIEAGQYAPATKTPEPQEPTPIPANYDGLQALKDNCAQLAEKHQLGIISGNLHVPEDVYCQENRILGLQCSLYVQDVAGETLFFNATEYIHFDPLPEKYTSQDFILRSHEHELIPNGGQVTIAFRVTKLSATSECIYYPSEITYQP